MYSIDSGLLDCDGVHQLPPGGFKQEARTLFDALLKSGALKPGEPLRVLDIGCGRGVFLAELKHELERLGVPVEAHGVSLRVFDPAFARKHSLHVHVSNAEELAPEWSDRFHLVVSTGVLKWLQGHLKAVLEAHRVLHPQGRAFLHVGADHWGEVDWARIQREHPEKQVAHEAGLAEFGKGSTPLRLYAWKRD